RGGALAFGDEAVTRDLAHGGEHAFVADAARGDLLAHHALAGARLVAGGNAGPGRRQSQQGHAPGHQPLPGRQHADARCAAYPRGQGVKERRHVRLRCLRRFSRGLLAWAAPVTPLPASPAHLLQVGPTVASRYTSSSRLSRLALPPVAAVLTVSTRSTAKRCR